MTGATVKMRVDDTDVAMARQSAAEKDHTNNHKPEVRTAVDQLCADLAEDKVAAWMACERPGRYRRTAVEDWAHDGFLATPNGAEVSVEVKCRQHYRYKNDDHWLFLRENTNNRASDLYVQVVVFGDLSGIEDPSEVEAADIDHVEITRHIPAGETPQLKEYKPKVSDNPFVRYNDLHSLASLDSYARMLATEKAGDSVEA
jgi:hypothetical protein